MIKKNKNSFSELLGIIFGDGCLSRTGKKYIIYISGHRDEYDYMNHIKKLFNEIFDKEVNISLRKNENTLFIRFSDKIIFNILGSYLPIGNKYEKLNIPDFILTNKRYFFNFLRGLFDTDGCLVLSKQHKNKPYYPRIEITSKSEAFLKQILFYLKKSGFYGSVSSKGKKGYRLEISGFKNFEFWKKNIGTKNSKNLKRFKAVKN
jgi:intein/homing endonuclease